MYKRQVLLPWTPPYDWAWMVGFLQARAVAGVERFDEGGYSRSFGVEGHRGLIHLAPDEEAQGLRVTPVSYTHLSPPRYYPFSSGW